MRGTSSSRAACAAFAVAAVLAAALPACGTVDTLKTKVASDPETTARNAAPDDPQARAMQVGWTSARASYCGFIFDPAQLRASYLASEARAGKSPEEIAKLERAYDYTRELGHREHQKQSRLLQQGANQRYPARPQPLSGRRLHALGTDGPVARASAWAAAAAATRRPAWLRRPAPSAAPRSLRRAAAGLARSRLPRADRPCRPAPKPHRRSRHGA